jgi:hypothetical protein
MEQTDLFAAEPAAPAYAYRPDPEKVRARLERILGQARAADVLPWDRSRLGLYRVIVPDMTRWLPEEEGAAWRAEFDAHLSRLDAA